MTKRSPAEWQTLISEYEASGLTITAFCKDQEICRKHFGQYRNQLQKKTNIKTANVFVPITIPVHTENPMLEFHYKNHLVIKLPLSVTAIWLAEFIQQL